MNKRKISLIFIALIVIFLLALITRSKNIFSGDFYFLSDQARDLVLVRDMIADKKPPLIGARAGFEGLFHGPLWIWILGIPFLIFKGDPQLISIFYIIVSLSVVVLPVFLFTKLYGWKVGLLSSLLIAGSSWLIKAGPFTTNAQVMPFIFIFYLYFLIRYIRGNNSACVWAAFFAGLGFQFEGAFSATLLPYLFFVSLTAKKASKNVKYALFSVAAFIVSLSTFLLFDLKHKFLLSNSLLRLLGGHSMDVLKGYEQYSNIFFRIKDRTISLINSPFSVLPNNSHLLNLLFVIVFAIAALALFKNKKKDSLKKEFSILIFFPIYFYFIFILFPYPVWEHYTYSIPVLMSLVFALSLNEVFKLSYLKFIIPLFLLIYFISIYQLISLQYSLSNSELPKSDGSYKNQLKIVDAVFADAKNSNFGYFVYNTQVFTYGMDYLFWWRGKYKYAYLPVSQKLNYYYLIMYPPKKDDQSAHDFWKKKVIKNSGKPIYKQIMNGGIVIEKFLKKENEASVDPNYFLNIR